MNCFKSMLSTSMLFATLLAGSSTFASALTSNSSTTPEVKDQPDSSLLSQTTATTKACQYVSYGVTEQNYNKVYNDFKSKKNAVPYWIDAYEYQGKPYYNIIFHCNSNSYPYYAAHKLTGQQYAQDAQKYKAQGYRQVHFDSYLDKGKVYYAAIFVKSSGPSWAAYYNQTLTQYQQTYGKLTKDGYRPVNVSYVYYNKNWYVTSLYDKKAVGTYVHAYNLTYDKYKEAYNKYTKEGKKPAYLNSYTANGQTYFSAIFNQEQYSAWKYATKQDSKQFGSTYNTYYSQGYLTRYVTGYEYSGKAYYDGYWTK